MRLYVDEDIASRELLARLTGLGHEVSPPLRRESDHRCWRHAQDDRAAVLTMNAVDFVRLAEAQPAHHGLLLVYRENDPRTDMTAATIAAAVDRVTQTYRSGIAGLILVVNQFRW